jgi:hypothetical protein
MDNPVTVCVWTTRGSLINDPGRFNFNDHGHASMQVGYKYLSFWPANRGGKLVNSVAVFIPRQAKFMDSYSEDCAEMGRRADHLIRLASINNEKALSYWNVETTLSPKFHLFQTNCSTMVGRTLLHACDKDIRGIVGLVESALSILLAETFYWEPQKVLEVAQALQ